MSGFGNEFTTEDPRCPGALPESQVLSLCINLKSLIVKPYVEDIGMCVVILLKQLHHMVDKIWF